MYKKQINIIGDPDRDLGSGIKGSSDINENGQRDSFNLETVGSILCRDKTGSLVGIWKDA